MTREEAIELIEHISIAFVPTDQYGDYDDPQPYDEALDMAIEALSAPTDGDLISRQDIKYHVQLEAMGNGQYEEVEIAYKNDIESLPSADRPTGEWVNKDGTPSKALYSLYCSECGEWSEYRGNYCLNCGAKMGGGAND